MLDSVTLRSLALRTELSNFSLFDVFHLSVVLANLVEPRNRSIVVPRVYVSKLGSLDLLIGALFGSAPTQPEENKAAV